MTTSTAKKRKLHFIYDQWLLIATFSLIAIGLLMVTSASMVISDRQYGYPFHYFLRQGAYLISGMPIALVVLRIKLETWQKISGYLLIISIVLLVVVLIPGVGKEVNGSSRWLGFGPFSIQVSEFAKLCVVIYMAGYLVRHEETVRNHFVGFANPMIILGFMAVLLLLEPDFGTTAVIMVTSLGMMFLAGARLWQFLVLLALVGTVLVILTLTSPYRMQRLASFTNPWANPYGSGYQLTQSLIAFGRGGLFGVGLGNSIQKLFYLPEAHTDFLFAVLAEELGLIGELLVLSLFAVLVGRAFFLGRLASLKEQPFAAYLAYGFSFWLALQAMINIGVNSGMLPTKGLTLPFMSYGGSSMWINYIVIALLLRISYELRVGVPSVSRTQKWRPTPPKRR